MGFVAVREAFLGQYTLTAIPEDVEEMQTSAVGPLVLTQQLMLDFLYDLDLRKVLSDAKLRLWA